MKTFLSTIIIGAALLRGICYADPPAPSSAPLSSGRSANTSANPPPGPTPQAPPTKPAVAAKAPLPEIKITDLKNTKDRPSNVIQPAGPLFRDARNHGPVTGLLGGPAKSKTAPVISGTSINHKPL